MLRPRAPLVLALVALVGLACSAPATPPAPAKPTVTAPTSAAPAPTVPVAPTAPPVPVALRIGLSAPTPQELGIWSAQAAGIAQRYGLNLEIFSTGGGSRGLQILQSQEIDGMYVGLAPLVLARLGGADAVLIAATANTIPFVMYSRPDVTSGATLRGGRVAISTFASESDVAVTLALHDLGLERDDVTVLQIGSPAERLAALTSGAVQMAPLLPPSTLQADRSGMRRLLDLAERRTPWVFDGLVVRGADVAARADVMQRLLRAHLEGQYWARANPEAARRILADYLRQDDPEALDIAYREFLRLFVPDGRPSAEGARAVLDTLAATDPRVRDTPPSDYLDPRPLDALQAAGFVDALGRQYAR